VPYKELTWSTGPQIQFPQCCVFYFLEFRAVDKFQMPSNFYCYTPSWELVGLWRRLTFAAEVLTIGVTEDNGPVQSEHCTASHIGASIHGVSDPSDCPISYDPCMKMSPISRSSTTSRQLLVGPWMWLGLHNGAREHNKLHIITTSNHADMATPPPYCVACHNSRYSLIKCNIMMKNGSFIPCTSQGEGQKGRSCTADLQHLIKRTANVFW
jgi:hypothetical protein